MMIGRNILAVFGIFCLCGNALPDSSNGVSSTIVLENPRSSYKMDDLVIFDVLYRTNQPLKRYVYRFLTTGRGIILDLRDEKGNQAKPLQLPQRPTPGPPPLRPDTFFELTSADVFGVREKFYLKELVSAPGKYKLKVITSPAFTQSVVNNPYALTSENKVLTDNDIDIIVK